MPIALLEVCVTSVKDAIAAERAGASRIELCSSLEVGGLTPSGGLMTEIVKNVQIPVHALIRPRAGNFVYDNAEIDIMHTDIRMAHQAGCSGIVIGPLNEHNIINKSILLDLRNAAGDMDITFHRAFDDIEDQIQAIEDILEVCGGKCTRILTSGGRPSAREDSAKQQIKRLIEVAGKKIRIMPGAGITPENVRTIIDETGAKEVHASCKRVVGIEEQGKSLFATPLWETDEKIVARMVDVLKS